MAKLPKNSSRGSGFSLQFQSVAASAFSPADATTYYMGFRSALGPDTLDLISAVLVPASGFLNTATFSIRNSTTPASNEASSVYLRHTTSAGTTDYLISDAVDISGTVPIVKHYTRNDINLQVSQGDFLQIKWVTPTWATNPGAITLNSLVVIRR